MRRITISVFAICIAVLLAPQNVTAQPFSGASGEVFRQEGIASWYGAQFEGRPTASGEIFNPNLFTAAHPTLPFGTFLIVTNRSNNRQVSVRVNDRGPFVDGRIIDVSQAAAEHLGMIVTGTAPVIIETIPGGNPPPAPRPQVQAQPQPQPQVVAWQPPQTVAQPQPVAVHQPPAQQPAPAPVPVTTTVPAEAAPNTPITINIFHTPHDPSLPPTVEVVQTPEPQPERVIAWHQPEPEPQVTVVENFWHVPQPVVVQDPQPQHSPMMENAMAFVSVDPSNTYRVQVGSFRVARNAVDTFVRLRAADFEPVYERSGEFFRVVLMGIPGTEVQSTLDRLIALGYNGVMVSVE